MNKTKLLPSQAYCPRYSNSKNHVGCITAKVSQTISHIPVLQIRMRNKKILGYFSLFFHINNSCDPSLEPSH